MPQNVLPYNPTIPADQNNFFGALTKGLQQTAELKSSAAAVQNMQLHNMALQQLLADHTQDHDLQTQMLQAQIQQQQAQTQLAKGTLDDKVLEEHQNLLHAKALTDSLNLDMETQKQLRPSLMKAKDLEAQFLTKQVNSYDLTEAAKRKALEAQTDSTLQDTDMKSMLLPIHIATGYGQVAAQQANIDQTKAQTDLINKQALGFDSTLSGNILDKKLKLITALTGANFTPGTRSALLQSISDSDPDFAKFKQNPDILDDKSLQGTIQQALLSDTRTAAKTLLLSKGLPPETVFPKFVDGKMVSNPTKDYEAALTEIMQKAIKDSNARADKAKVDLLRGAKTGAGTGAGNLFNDVPPQSGPAIGEKSSSKNQPPASDATAPTDLLRRTDYHIAQHSDVAEKAIGVQDSSKDFKNFEAARPVGILDRDQTSVGSIRNADGNLVVGVDTGQKGVSVVFPRDIYGTLIQAHNFTDPNATPAQDARYKAVLSELAMSQALPDQTPTTTSRVAKQLSNSQEYIAKNKNDPNVIIQYILNNTKSFSPAQLKQLGLIGHQLGLVDQ